MKIFLSSDHAGFDLKQKLIPYINKIGHEAVDKGPFEFNGEDDYPDFIVPVAKEVSANPNKVRAIVLGGSGQGEAIVANRYPGVRAVVYYGGSLEIIRLSRDHNDSNVLSLGSRFLNQELAEQAIKLWLDTSFSGQDRHTRRINKIDAGAMKESATDEAAK